MVIKAQDLDKDVKDILRNTIMTGLFREYSTLPTETDKIDKVLEQDSMKSRLDGEVKQYYRDMVERDVKVEISATDYRQVWLHMV